RRPSLTNARMPRSATPNSPGAVAWIDSRRSSIRLKRSYMFAANQGTRLCCHFSTTVTAQSGSSPTNLEPRGAAVREAQDVVVEAVLLVPHAVGSDPVHGATDL